MFYFKRFLTLILLFYTEVSLAQKENFIKDEVTSHLNNSRMEQGYGKFNNDNNLIKVIDFYLENLVTNDQQADLKALTKQYGINVFTLNVYPVRFLNEEIWKEQLQYIIDAEKTNNSTMTSANDFFRHIAVRKNKFNEYLVTVSYGTYLEIGCWSGLK
jgi:hypothetical protein